jgi:hypothetical protein
MNMPEDYGERWMVAPVNRINYPHPWTLSCMENVVGHGHWAIPQILLGWSEIMNREIMFKM